MFLPSLLIVKKAATVLSHNLLYFRTAAFTAEIGAIVGPVQTQFGYHLIKVEEKKDAAVADFEEVKNSIRNQLLQQIQNKVYSDKVKELREKYVHRS